MSAQYLGGMLNQIAGTLGQGIDINGMNAGQALGDNIRNAVAPSPNTNDPESLREYAQWLQNNGRGSEAMQYREKADKIEKDRDMAGRMGLFSEEQGKGVAAIQQGDTAALRQNIARLQEMAGGATDPQERLKYQQEVRRMQGQMGQAASTGRSMNGQRLAAAEEALNQPGLDPRAKQAIEQRIAVMKQEASADPEMFDAYRAAKEQKYRAEAVDREMQSTAWMQENTAALDAAIASDDAAAVEEIVGGAGVAGAAARGYVAERQRFQTGLDDMAKKARDMRTPMETESILTSIEGLGKEFATPVRKMVEAVGAYEDEHFHNGLWDSEVDLLHAEALRQRAVSLTNSMVSQHAQMTSARVARAEASRVQDVANLRLQLEGPILLSTAEREEIRLDAKMRGLEDEDAGEFIDRERERIKQAKRGVMLRQLNALLTDEERGDEPERLDTGPFTVSNVQGALDRAEPEAVYARMLDGGLSEEAIASIWPEDVPIPSEDELAPPPPADPGLGARNRTERARRAQAARAVAPAPETRSLNVREQRGR